MISIIIPFFNEQTTLQTCVRDIISKAKNQPIEIILSDGGSTDGSTALAKKLAQHKKTTVPIRYVLSKKGRATQMNAGAAQAKGDIFVFLHADVHIPSSFFTFINKSIAQGYVGGGFSTWYDHPSFLFRMIECYANFRARQLHVLYGDQGIFARRDIFLHIGGYEHIPLMEDVAFSTALKQQGRIAVSKDAMFTSPRRFLKKGIVRQALLNGWLQFLYRIGMNPQTLAKKYH